MSRLFISHSSANNTEAVAIRDWLAREGWDEVFLDLDPARGIAAGERWERALNEAASRCEAVVFLISRAWLDSRWCLKEFNLAHRLNKRLFGVLVETIPLADLPEDLSGTWQVVDLASGHDHEMFRVALPRTQEESHVTFSREGLARLRGGLARAGLEPRFFDWPPKDDPERPPYRGLKPLEAEDAGIFFGRDAPIVEALDRMRGLREAAAPRLLVILGASGSGKSSFLRAGILPRLARDDRNFLPLPAIRPEHAALTGDAGLVPALEAALAAHGLAFRRADIRKAVAGGAETTRPLLQQIADKAFARTLAEERAAPQPTIVIAIDQAEELFTADGLSEGEALLALLRDLAAEDRPGIIVLFTIRSDSYDRLETAKPLEGLRQQTLPLLPMPRGAYQTVIEGPAARLATTDRRLRIEPRLTQRLLEDIEKGGGSDALPLLAFTLEQLYRDYGGQGALTSDDYEAFGGIGGAIEAAVERALKAADSDPRIPREREARLLLLRRGLIPWLAGIDPETGSPRRRIARLADVPPEAASLIGLLVEQRLLSTDAVTTPDGARETTIEPAHEALLRQWGLLRGWLEEDLGALTTLEAVKRAARDWAANAKAADWLNHAGGRLEDAEQVAARLDFAADLSEEARDYLAACRARGEAERRDKEEALAREAARLSEIAAAQARTGRFQRGVRWALAVIAAVVGIGIGAVGWQQYRLAAGQRALDERQVNLLAELASGERLGGNADAGLRLAVHGAILGQRLDRNGARRAPLAAAELAVAVWQSRWRLLLSGHQDQVSSATFSPDGTRIVTASWDKTARIWDAATGQQLAVLRGHEGYLSSAAFSPDGTRIVTASWDETARIWDAATGKQIVVLGGQEGLVWSAAFSPDGSRIVTASADVQHKTASIWDAATGKQIAVLRGHEDQVNSAAFSPDGTRIVTASSDRTVRIWDAATGHQIAVLRGHEGAVWRAVFSPDGSRIVMAPDDETARIWDVMTAKEIAVLRGKEGTVTFAAFSADGSHIVTAARDKTARIWDAATGKQIAVLRGHGGDVSSAVFNPDGTRIVTSSSDKTVRIWDVEMAKEIAALRGHQDAVNSAAFSSDGTRIVTASGDKTARIWDAATGQQIALLRGHEDRVSSAAFSPDGTRVVTASRDATARIWITATGKQIAVLGGQDSHVLSAAFSPDGLRIVTGSDAKTARIWDAATAKEIAVLRGHEGRVSFAAFSPDGTRIVTASDDKTARIWDTATTKEIAVLRGHEGSVWWAAFSPDGLRIVTASDDNTARIWDAATAKEIVALRGQESLVVISAAFSADGSRIVTASDDKTARIWDATTGREIAVLRGHEDAVNRAAFSPDGLRIVTASDDKTARIWDVHFATMATKGLITEACTRRLLGLTKLTRDEMRLAGYPDTVPLIEVCVGVE